MGTVPTVYVPVAGDDATQARVLTWADGINFLLGTATSGGSKRAVAELRQTVASAMATSVWTDITFDSEDVDYDLGHSTSTNTARYTAQTDGWYQLSGGIDFVGAVAGARRGARWSVNGTAISASDSVLANTTSGSIMAVPARTIKVFLSAGDYVTLQGFQDTGGSLNTSVVASGQSSMSVEWRSN